MIEERMIQNKKQSVYLFYVLLLFIFAIMILPGWSLAAKTPSPVTVTEEAIEKAADLQEREKVVLQKEKNLEQRQQELLVLGKEIEEKMNRLDEMQADVEKKIAYIESIDIRDKEFRNLIKIYSAMSASKLAPLLDRMEDITVAKILRAMKTDAVAKIVPKLDNEKAVRVSQLLGMIN